MQILRHGQVAMTVEIYSEVSTAKKRSQAAGREARWLGLLYGSQKEPIRRSKSALEVELRGFEPLTPSMRTLGGPVAWGRWGRSAIDGSLSKPLAVGEAAVLARCTAPGPAVVRYGSDPRIKLDRDEFARVRRRSRRRSLWMRVPR